MDNFNYSIIFKDPLTVELSPTTNFNLIDYRFGAKDVIALKNNYIVKILEETVPEQGVVIVKIVEYNLGVAIHTYTFTNINPTFSFAFSFLGIIITWENYGTALILTQKLADAFFNYTAPFARICLSNTVKMNPQ